MSKHLLWLLWMPLLLGCKKDHGYPAHWESRRLVSGGSVPVASDDGRWFLYTRETSPAGLYVFDFNDWNSRRIPVGNDLGFRSDYAWSHDGEWICVSSPSDGIFVSNVANPASFNQIWTLGSHPRFLPGDSLLVCAGPEDGSANQGVRIMTVGGEFRQLISAFGSRPEPSPDGHKIAFLATSGGSSGRTLIVYNRNTQILDTLGQNVLNYSWLGDSETLVYEAQDTLRSAIFLTALGSSNPVWYSAGAQPDGDREGSYFFYVAVNADASAGIRRGSPGGGIEHITDTEALPCMLAPDGLLYQSADGILQAYYDIAM